MLIIIRGVSGSGKSTLAKLLRNEERFHRRIFEADQYFETADGYKFDGTKLLEAHADCLERTREWLERGPPSRQIRRVAIVSNTFTQRWEYQPYLDMAAELNVPVQVIDVHGNFQNVHGVPADKVASMRARWEPHVS